MKASRIIRPCRRVSFCLFVIMVLFTAVAYSSKPGANSKGARITEFLNPDGSLDMEAVRRSGYRGDLDLEGFDVRLDPATGGPLLSPKSAVLAGRDPDDQYWHDLAVPDSVMNGTVRTLTVYDNELIAGGYFPTAGGKPARRIAAWAKTSGFICCDVDSDNAVNMLDIFYLITFLYKGGPEPVCP